MSFPGASPRRITAVEQSGKVPVTLAFDQLLTRVQEHFAGRPFNDDATVLLVERE